MWSVEATFVFKTLKFENFRGNFSFENFAVQDFASEGPGLPISYIVPCSLAEKVVKAMSEYEREAYVCSKYKCLIPQPELVEFAHWIWTKFK